MSKILVTKDFDNPGVDMTKWWSTSFNPFLSIFHIIEDRLSKSYLKKSTFIIIKK